MLDVEVRGFQSIEHLKIRIDGFTALVGRSNIGKSALVRAIKCALTNSLGTSFVRHNPQECARALRKAKSCRCQASVHLKTDGFDLLWEKGDAVNRYTFNGQQYDKPGQGIPEFLVTNGLGTVKVGDDVGLIQVADQFFPIFLLNQSGPAAAEAISDVARLDRINAASRMVDKDRREAIATKKVREKDAEDLRGRLTAYEGLDAAIGQAQKAGEQLAAVQDLQAKVDTLASYALTAESLLARIRSLWAVGSVLIPDEGSLRANTLKIAALQKFSEDLIRRVDRFKAVAWVEDFLKKVPTVDPVTKAVSGLAQLDGWIARLRTYQKRFANLEAIDKLKLPAPEPLTVDHAKLRDVSKFITRLKAVQVSIQALEKELEEVSKEEEAVQGEVDALGVCPTCTQPFQVGHQHA